MTKLWMLLIAPVGLSIAVAQTPDITGTWQGTLKAPNDRDMRIVMKIAKADTGLKATVYSIDQGGQPLTAATTSHQGGTYRFTVPGIDGSYTG